jgi:hypothetical protein
VARVSGTARQARKFAVERPLSFFFQMQTTLSSWTKVKENDVVGAAVEKRIFRCAAHKVVSSFGRNEGFGWGKENSSSRKRLAAGFTFPVADRA